jgi:hypothetical protein
MELFLLKGDELVSLPCDWNSVKGEYLALASEVQDLFDSLIDEFILSIDQGKYQKQQKFSKSNGSIKISFTFDKLLEIKGELLKKQKSKIFLNMTYNLDQDSLITNFLFEQFDELLLPQINRLRNYFQFNNVKSLA